MNNCNFIGRLTMDPEAKSTASGKALVNFSIAVDRGFKDSQGNRLVDFISCTAWDKTGTLITQYFHKGDLIGINGRLETRTYEDNGTKRTAYSIVVNNIDFIQGKSENKTEAQAPKVENTPPTPPTTPIEDLATNYELPVEIEEDTPFDI